jgi:hypothetical protein
LETRVTGSHEPDRDGSADEPTADAADADAHVDAHADPQAAAEDAAWLAIVANYGDRVELPADDLDTDPVEEVPGSPRELLEVEEPRDTDDDPQVVAREDHFVPPPPPPIPRTAPARMIAWVGLFGVPLAVLLAVVTSLPVPQWLGLILMVWFVGGFVFLVASMRPGPRDDTDDGAVL